VPLCSIYPSAPTLTLRPEWRVVNLWHFRLWLSAPSVRLPTCCIYPSALQGKIVSEWYNALLGVTADTRLISWSVAKSITSAAVAIRSGLHSRPSIHRQVDGVRRARPHGRAGLP
jgi:hypothetical protein